MGGRSGNRFTSRIRLRTLNSIKVKTRAHLGYVIEHSMSEALSEQRWGISVRVYAFRVRRGGRFVDARQYGVQQTSMPATGAARRL